MWIFFIKYVQSQWFTREAFIKIHPRYFTFARCLVYVPLYTIIKDFVSQGLCLVLINIDFDLSCPKSILNLLLTNQSHKLEKSLIRKISVRFYVGKLHKYHQHKVKNCWQQLGARHLCKVEPRVDLKDPRGTSHNRLEGLE